MESRKWSEKWTAGTPRGKSVILHKENGFSIAADKRINSLEERISKLIARMYPYHQRLREVCDHFEAELSCALYVVGSDVPSLHLPLNTMQQLAHLRAEVDVDLYFFPDEREAA